MYLRRFSTRCLLTFCEFVSAMNSCLWNGHQALPNEQMEQLRALYNSSGTTIPLDVRTKLSDWIISKFAPSGVLAPPHFDAANNQVCSLDVM